MYPKDPYEVKYQFLINKREGVDLKEYNDSKSFIEYSNDMNNLHKNIEKYIPDKERKTLIIFPLHKKLNPTVVRLFIGSRKVNISLVFITQSYVAVPKNVRLNKSFNVSYLIIHQILTMKTLWLFTTALQNHIFVSDSSNSCIRYPFMFLKESFKKNTEANHDNLW